MFSRKRSMRTGTSFVMKWTSCPRAASSPPSSVATIPLPPWLA